MILVHTLKWPNVASLRHDETNFDYWLWNPLAMNLLQIIRGSSICLHKPFLYAHWTTGKTVQIKGKATAYNEEW